MSENSMVKTMRRAIADTQLVIFGVVILLATVMATSPVMAQGDPRSNVNVVGMTPDPADIPDTYYRQQNEPACAVRPGDSACIICAYNDYRAVELFGDAWEGVSQSCDAGNTWRSRLAPGHPNDQDAQVIPAEFAADPRLAAIPGMAIFNFIAGYRDSNVGVLAIQHWLEVTKEDADHYEPSEITWFADTGTSGRFLDKPDMLAVLDPAAQQTTVELVTEMENKALGTNGVIIRDFPTGTLYVAYAVFTGSSSIKVLVKTSDDWGRTWKNQALKLSEDQNEVSGISLTAVGNKVLAVWRRKGDNNDPDSILYSVISNGGKKATKGEVLADICEFDQPTLTGTEPPEITPIPLVAFRTNDFPWTANDGNNVYVFYSDRGRDSVTGACNENGPARIVMHYSTDAGQSWNTDNPRIEIDPVAKDIFGNSKTDSFQFMPAAFGANGKVQLAWYDTRNEQGVLEGFPFVADYEFGATLQQRTVDVYTTNVTMGTNGPLIPEPVRVSQFSIVAEESGESYESKASFGNKKLFSEGNAPFLGDYIAIAAREYREITSGANQGKWESNASLSGGKEDFFAAWTSNRDVVGEINLIGDPLNYSYTPETTGANNVEDDATVDEMAEKPMLADSRPIPENGPPRDSAMIAQGLDGSDNTIFGCYPETERTRDANIYGSLIKDQVRFYAPTPAKPLSGVVRAFVVALSNSDIDSHTYDLKIVRGDCNALSCKASFRQKPSFPPFGGDFLEEPGVTVPGKSTLARTVFIAGDQDPVTVEAYENGNLISKIRLGNSTLFEDPENCGGDPSCDVTSSELHNLELQTVDARFLASLIDANLLNANLLNLPPSVIDYAVDNGCCAGEVPPTAGSVIKYLDTLSPEGFEVSGDPDITNAALLNAALLNANLLNASLLNADLLNAALLNANLLNVSYVDKDFDQALIDAAIAGGLEESTLTIGSLLLYAADPANGINAALLNAALLNASLLNANLLNASLLNANLLNANLLNANLLNQNPENAALLNAALLNANLLNTEVEAAALLNVSLDNANLLNADLLNANLLNPTLVDLATEGGCCEGETVPSIGSILLYAVANPDTINAALLNASLLNANLLNANLLNADLLNANLLNADLLNANLLNADLLNANLLNADLLNANLLNANLLNASLLNSAMDDGVPVTYDDYTYPLTNNGNVTTAIDADVAISAPMINVMNEDGVEVPVMDVIGTKLMTWTANATPTVVNCVERVQLDTRVQSITGTDQNFQVADIDNPFDGQVSAVVRPGETVFVTVRVIGTRTQLRNTRVSAFTASSQAANCFPDPDNSGKFICDDELTNGDEQIVFEDTDPPIITAQDITVEAITAGGTFVDDYEVTVFDASDPNPVLTCMPEKGALFDIGETPVTCGAIDASGNEAVPASFKVTVIDRVPPTISQQEDIIVFANAIAGSAAIYTPTTSDNYSDVTVTCIPPSGTVFDIGPTHAVTCTAKDADLNEASMTFNVAVIDRVAPTISQLDVVVDATNIAGSAAFYTPTTDDNYSAVTFSCDSPSGTVFDIGPTHPVTCTATDEDDNTASVTFNVAVIDRVPPTIILLPDDNPVVLEAGTALWVDVDPGVTVDDNFSTATLTIAYRDEAGAYIAAVNSNVVGTYYVDYTATDENGNSATVTRTVTVFDDTPPEIGFELPLPENCLADDDGVISCDFTATGPAGAFVDFLGIVTASDLGQPIDVSCSTISPSTVVGTPLPATLPPGDYTVECTADDGYSIAATIQISVDVVDETGPVVDVSNAVTEIRADIRYFDDIVGDFVYFDLADPTWTELSGAQLATGVTAQDVVSLTIDPANISCSRVDPDPDPVNPDKFDFSDELYTIECTAIDEAGNKGTATYNLTVLYLYDITLIPPKGRARAGSTVPLDWQYFDSGVLVDSSAFNVGIIWEKTADTSTSQSCSDLTPVDTDGSSFVGDIPDSGQSDFRYSSADNIWQFSWQTPDVTGWHRVSVVPPGGDTDGAWACINLR